MVLPQGTGGLNTVILGMVPMGTRQKSLGQGPGQQGILQAEFALPTRTQKHGGPWILAEFLQQGLQTQKRTHQNFAGPCIPGGMQCPRSVGRGQGYLGALEAGLAKNQGGIPDLKARGYQSIAFGCRDIPLPCQGQALFGGKDGAKTTNPGMKARTNGRGSPQDVQNDHPCVLDNGRPQFFGGKGHLQQKTLICHSEAVLILWWE
jgi:hypothetical protein